MSDLKCVAGCNIFSYHEAIHHKDCPCYQDSLTKYNDDKIKSLEKAIAILGKSKKMYDQIPNDIYDVRDYFAELCESIRDADIEVKELLGEKEYQRILNEKDN